jgi:hypothetical protein
VPLFLAARIRQSADRLGWTNVMMKKNIFEKNRQKIGVIDSKQS